MPQYRVIGATRPRQGRPNKDGFLLWPDAGVYSQVAVFLADGISGLPGSAEAAQAAVQAGLSFFEGAPREEIHSPSFWVDLVINVDRTISRDVELGYTSLIALTCLEGFVIGASNGDSQAYVIGPGVDYCLTRLQAKIPAIGSGRAHPTPFAFPLDAGNRVLAVTDGIWKNISPASILETCLSGDVDRVPGILIAKVHEAWGDGLADDTTVIVIE